MPAPKQKYYAVRQGRKQGIFLTWDECSRQVIGFAGAVYKAFPSREEAEAFMNVDTGSADVLPEKKAPVRRKKPVKDAQNTDNTDKLIGYLEKARGEFPAGKLSPFEAFAYVDGSYDIRTKTYSCGCVFITSAGVETFSDKGSEESFRSARNVAGELMGTMLVAKTATERGISELTVYHDYTGISMWYNGLWKAESPVALNYIAYMNTLRPLLNVKFVKVAGHTGVYLNEAADLLAKAELGI